MIFNNESSIVQIRLHIAELLKDKIEQDNFVGLCEKMEGFVMKNVQLPLVKKNPLDELQDFFAESLKNNLLQDVPTPSSNRKNDIRLLAENNLCKDVKISKVRCYICGYSNEFNCLIAGTDEPCESSVNLGDTDVIIVSYCHYFYVSKDIVSKS